jgi:aldose 1-epimerase
MSRGRGHLVLVGMMGAGKTTVATALAHHLGWPMRDGDRDLEQRTGRTGAEVAADEGVDELHRLEAELLLDALATDGPSVVAASASTVASERLRRELARRATVVWLDVPVEVLAGRMAAGAHRRPVDQDAAAVLLAGRRAHLEEVADLRLDAQAPIGELVSAILTLVRPDPPHLPVADEPTEGSTMDDGRREDFGRRHAGDRATRFTLGGDGGLVAQVTDHGATLVAVHVPDRDGGARDVVLGFDSVEGYESDGNAYLGATIGRVANRIAHATFELGGRRYELAPNETPHHLHGGGERSFDRVRWEVADRAPDALALRHVSPDGEEGYPGRLEATVVYRVEGDTLSVAFEAVTDAPTPVDLTNHTYWNLRGEGTVLEHELQILADRVLTVDDDLLPTGAFTDVADGPLDLREPVRLRTPVETLATAPSEGLDHHYVLRGEPGRLRRAAVLHDPSSGRTLEVATDQPGLQVYTAGHLDPVAGKRGRRCGRFDAVCLEPQHHPGALQHPGFPSIVLEPGRTYRHLTTYRVWTAT